MYVTIFTLRASVLSVVTKIARSRVLGICACCNYHRLVDIGEKLVSVCFKLLNMAWHGMAWLTSATNRAFSVQLACGLPTAPTPHADVTQLRMLDLNTGKDRQVMKWILHELECFPSAWSASVICYNGWRARGVCALESSSSTWGNIWD